MEVHQGIRNARLQGDYSDYALTEPCSLRSTDFPSGMVADDFLSSLYQVFSGLKTYRESFGHMDQQEEKAGKTEPKGARSCHLKVDRLSLRDRSTHLHTTSSIDPMQANQLDRSRSVSAVRSIPFGLSRSIRPAQMISQPFDLLSANRLDRTVANRIEPSSTPEPI
ncbi:unnamed protein product [Microthlaspi erraticum]|uniref:Uncharacterized protein n=1 Tax=Microthlaspi erraticum TaxID=1685480 RepID=A0A6D2KHS0_9BRAS|nr:unnamed protein product [Microthlaspi erraticum]